MNFLYKRLKLLILLIMLLGIIYIPNNSHAWWIYPEQLDTDSAYRNISIYPETYTDLAGYYHPGNCTWYCYGRAKQKLNVLLQTYGGGSLGSAGEWYNNAAQNGFEVGKEPRADSIICWEGHVAYVEAWNGTDVFISECNFNFQNNTNPHDYWERSFSDYSSYRNPEGNFLGFIYLKASDKEAPKLNYINIAKHATESSFTVTANITDNVKVTKVQFAVKAEGEADWKWYNLGNNADNNYNCTVKKSEHSNISGLYKVELHAYDAMDNHLYNCSLTPIPMGSTMATTLGNFTARIVPKADQSLALDIDGTTSGSNVSAKTKDLTKSSQLWKFEKQNDDTYKITNVSTGLALDIYGGRNDDKTNIEIYASNDTKAQRFCLMNYNGAYRVVGLCSPDWKAIGLPGLKIGSNAELHQVWSLTNPAQTFIFEKVAEKITLNKTSTEIYTGNSVTLTATITPTDVATKNVTWKSSNTSIATVDANGKVTGKGIGTATITATAADGSGVSKSCSVKVLEDVYDPNAKLTISKNHYQFNNKNETVQLEAKLSTGKGTAITWKSSNTQVATVDENGLVTSKRGGFSYITAKSQKYGELDCWVYVSYPVDLSDGAKAYVGDIDGNGIFDANDKSLILEMFKIEDKSADSKLLADIDGNGIIDANDAAMVLEAYQSEWFKIGNLATIRKVSIWPTKLNIGLGETTRLYASIIASNTNQDKTITWSSSNTAVAKVEQTGIVTGIKEGTATITAKTSNNKTATCVVTVKYKLPFTDVKEGSWYYDSVKYVYQNNIMTGLNTTTFGSTNNLTRGMMVMLLYKLEGQPTVTGAPKFPDVQDSSKYYYKAVKWATDKNIVTGYSNGNFGPTDKITRAQLAVILYRYAGYKKKDLTTTANLTGFADSNQVASWAQEAVKWAVGKGIISGNENKQTGVKTIDPKQNATRAQVATMIDN